ncbi:hypothetical protein PQ478_09025 [Alkalihalophilus pseudofirmus]|uniref:hypothetical protein n=1 Tax=Alkalihalophilus pseudofirmus TaxID=79885 RepID=UPI00259B0D57|nr:hypothetical protein [Alkalihalophilus pseudofirmus]WEG18613.1 hypothetical protein PQ478_09025 [Alkalihalophilus pseudofirmus]
MKKNFKFVLSDKLKKAAPHSANTEFIAEKHDSIDDLYVISWEEDGEWGVNNYLDEDVFDNVNNGSWVLVD